MAQLKVYYEPEMELLTIFWQSPRQNQICNLKSRGFLKIPDFLSFIKFST